jgi:hypothetical protein
MSRVGRHRRIELVSYITAALVGAASACDLPPDADDVERGDSESFDTATDTESGLDAVDGEVVSPLGCIQGLVCMIEQPPATEECLLGMDDASQDAAMAVAMCAFQSCGEVLDSTPDLLVCLVASCPEEALACIGSGFTGSIFEEFFEN